MSRFRWLGALLAIFVLSNQADAHEDVAGRWKVDLVRPEWQPEESPGTLLLEHRGDAWQGSLQFNQILFARSHRLEDVSVRENQVHFSVLAGEHVLNLTHAPLNE